MSKPVSVLTVPAFKDNYLWLIHDGCNAAAVDPGDAAPILAALKEHGLTLTAILLTHHHADHIGGVPELLRRFSVPVFGPRHDGIAAVTVPLGEGDSVEVPGLHLTLRVLDVPGHTRGHIAYVRDGAEPWVFCGDTLFAGGCGRLFEGTPAQMAGSLAKLAALPEAQGSTTLRAAGISYSTQLVATTADLPLVRNWPVAKGSFVTPADQRSYAAVVVLGQTVAQLTFPDDPDPVGRYLLMGNVPFQVIGVMSPKGATQWDSDQDDVVMVLFTANREVFGLRRTRPPEEPEKPSEEPEKEPAQPDERPVAER